VPLALAGALWTGGERPGVLVSDTGGLVGVMTEEGRALSRLRGDGFVAGIWLENDGDRATQEEAAARPGWVPDGAGMSIETGGLRIWHGAGRGSVGADQPDELALHRHLVLAQHPRLVGGVRRLERDHPAAPAEALQRRLLPLDQGHDDVAVLGRVLFLGSRRCRRR
jgi:hypothetical protein